MNLTMLTPGQSGEVAYVEQDHGRRLQDLGLIEGSQVQCLFRSPLGDPTAYLICGATVALRKKDAGHVILKRIWD